MSTITSSELFKSLRLIQHLFRGQIDRFSEHFFDLISIYIAKLACVVHGSALFE
jgi:hypothetical protein